MAETDTIQVKHLFSSQETVDIAKEQGRHMQSKTRLEEEFDSQKAAQKNAVMRLDADISDCTRKIMSGYEMRNVRCLILKGRPDNDSLLVVRTDNGKIASRRRMNADERQIELTTETPEVLEFEVDLCEDTDYAVVLEDVQITRSEAKELGPVEGLRIRPMARKIEGAA